MDDNLNYLDEPNKDPKMRREPDIVRRKYSGCSPEYNPISAWGYVGYTLLFAIPFIGTIFLILYALGAIGRIPVKKFARSYFCWIVLAVASVFLAPIILPIFGISISAITNFLTSMRDTVIQGFHEQLIPMH